MHRKYQINSKKKKKKGIPDSSNIQCSIEWERLRNSMDREKTGKKKWKKIETLAIVYKEFHLSSWIVLIFLDDYKV